MRVQLELKDDAVESVDTLREKLGLTSRAEVIRHSIAVLKWLTEKAEMGYDILAVKEGESVAKELRAPYLDFAAFIGRRQREE